MAIGTNAQGIADGMAFSMIQQDVNYDDFQLSIGASSFGSYTGFALVGGFKVTDNAFVNFGVTGSGNYAGSVNFKW